MKGAIAGDIIGSGYEHVPGKDKNFYFFYRPHKFTDDTVLTLATADAILNNKSFHDSYLEYANKYPNKGYGKHFKAWVADENRGPYNSFGNGSAMRVSPIGWYFNDLEKVLEEAKKSSEVTHDHPEGIKAAQSVASAIYLARNKASKTEIKNYIETNFNYDLSRDYWDFQPNYKHDFTAQGSVPEAIICFLISESKRGITFSIVKTFGNEKTKKTSIDKTDKGRSENGNSTIK